MDDYILIIGFRPEGKREPIFASSQRRVAKVDLPASL
jgi:hypothetical protein